MRHTSFVELKGKPHHPHHHHQLVQQITEHRQLQMQRQHISMLLEMW